MAWFKRRKEREPECIHSWFLADFETVDLSAGLDFDDVYVLRCGNCGAKKKIDDYEYALMKDLGLIKEAL